MSNDERHLPVINPSGDENQVPSCSPKIYVSNEEASLLAELRELRKTSLVVRRKLENADGDHRVTLESRLEELRKQRNEVARRRETAYVRKMIMLGHLPPDDSVDR